MGVVRVVLGLFAPFTPFVTEHLYQRLFSPRAAVACT
jgi:valyl-tRNA synthetase